MKIIISGALGHMGREVASQARAAGITVAAGVDPAPGQADFPLYASFAEEDVPADVLIDFSNPTCLEDLLAWAEARGVPAVLATTGYTPEQLQRIEQAAQHIAVFRSANMSVFFLTSQLSGLAHHLHCSGQPTKKTLVRVPGPSWVEYG